MKIRKSPSRTMSLLVILFLTAAFGAGCGAANRAANLDRGYTIKTGTKFVTGPATNETGKANEEIDVAKALQEELGKALEKKGLLWNGAKEDGRIVVPCKIVEYEPGNAFKRWLLPGWGATALGVRCDLKEDPGGRTVGSVEARRTVSAGGGYTVGAWKTIFTNVSDDVAAELESRIGAGGER